MNYKEGTARVYFDGDQVKIVPQCKCPEQAPTYPDFRENPHLPDCVWDRIQKNSKID